MEKTLVKKDTETYLREYNKRQAIKEIEREPQVTKVTGKKGKILIEIKDFKPREVARKCLKDIPTGDYLITIREPEGEYEKRYNVGLMVDAKRTDVPTGATQIHIMGEYDICEGDIKTVMRRAQRAKDWYATAKITLQILNNWKEKGLQHAIGIDTTRAIIEAATQKGKEEEVKKLLRKKKTPEGWIERAEERMKGRIYT